MIGVDVATGTNSVMSLLSLESVNGFVTLELSDVESLSETGGSTSKMRRRLVVLNGVTLGVFGPLISSEAEKAGSSVECDCCNCSRRLRLTKGSSSSSELLSFGRHKKDDVRPLKLRSPLSVS